MTDCIPAIRLKLPRSLVRRVTPFSQLACRPICRFGACLRDLQALAAWGIRLTLILAFAVLAGCRTELYTGLTQDEANEMLSVLLANRIEAEKTVAGDDGFSVLVPDDDVLAALDILSDRGLPRKVRQNMGEVFAKSGIVSSPFEERIRYIYALGESVASTLQQIDGVITARVHIVMPEAAELGQETKPSSASVFIKQRKDIDIDFLVPQIRRLVSNAIEGVSFDDVTVILVESQPETPLATRSDVALRQILPGLRIAEASMPMVWQISFGVLVLLLLSLIANCVLLFMKYRRRPGAKEAGDGKEMAT